MQVLHRYYNIIIQQIMTRRNFILILLVHIVKNLTFTQFINSTPEKYGIITVSHARNNNYKYIREHIDRYAMMECEQMAEISIVWNNDISPQQADIINPNWKTPVYFAPTPYNSMDFRYILPKQSKALVFFSIDDDIQTTCQQLKSSFDYWRSKAIGDLGPILSYGPFSYDFNTTQQMFIGIDDNKHRYFSMGLIGVSWVSRFYFDLYTFDISPQISRIRQIIRQKNNCDDIALNFIIAYYFPEFIPQIVPGDLQFRIKQASQSLTKTHYSMRDECIKQFTDILGYNPLKQIDRLKSTSEHIESHSNKYTVYAKRINFEQKLLNSSQNGQISRKQKDRFKNKIEKIRQNNVYYLYLVRGINVLLVCIIFTILLCTFMNKYKKQMKQNKQRTNFRA